MFPKLLIGVLVFITCTVHAQDNKPKDTHAHLNIDTAGIEREVERSRVLKAQMDSSFDRQQNKMAEEARKRDSANMEKGLDEFMQAKKEHDDKLSRELWFKGAFFVFILAVTIVGFVRRGRQRKQG